MGLFDNLLDRNPTRDWQADPSLKLVLDLDHESFGGIPLGNPAAHLQSFGPSPDAASARAGMFNYPGLGFQVNAERDVFVEVEMAFGEGGGAHAFAGRVIRHRNSKVLSGESSEADVVALLGAADNRTEEEADDDIPAHVTLLWHLRTTDLTADFEGGTLSMLWLGTKT